MIDFSTINKRITLESINELQDDFGGIVTTFSELKKIWGSVEDVNYSDNFFLFKKNTNITHKIITRFDPLISIKNTRLIYKQRIFDIQFISKLDFTDKWIQIACVEKI